MRRPRVVGIGSSHGDDQVGWLILDSLRDQGYPTTHLQRLINPIDLLDDIEPSDSLILCDACQSGDERGTIKSLTWPVDSAQCFQLRSSHQFGIFAVLELAKQLQRCPNSIEIWAVTGVDWRPGAIPGSLMNSAAQVVAELIIRKYGDA
jgi:hydrogenase maturation protease